MWYITDLQGQNKHFLLPNKQCIVGRKLVDLVLSDDQSVSRKHAELNVVGNAECTAPSVASVTDSGSKYGTFISISAGDWQRLTSGEEHELKSGDTIRFGLQTNIWRIQCEETITTTSNLKAELKADLKNNLRLLGGQLKNQWRGDCTHLTMSQITLTVKAVCAMASGSPIVTPEYWKCYYNNVSENKPPPDYHDFIPPVAEQTINTAEVSFSIIKSRKNMFEGKLFVFATKPRLKELAPMIIAAGGSAVELQTSSLSLRQLVQPHVIVVSYFFNPTQEPASEEYTAAEKHLKEKGLRVIPESEIGLAVLYCSMEKYCNPSHDFTNTFLANCDRSPSTLSRTAALDLTSQVLAYDTLEIQDQAQSTLRRTQNVVVVPESETIGSNSRRTQDLFQSHEGTDKKTSVSPIKQEVVEVEEDDFVHVSTKRRREPEENDRHTLKKPNIGIQASGTNNFSRCKSSTSRKLVRAADKDDSFEFPMNKKSKHSKGNQDAESDVSFDFPPSTSSYVKTAAKSAVDVALFEPSASSVQHQGTSAGKYLDDDEDMFADLDDSRGEQPVVMSSKDRMPPPCHESQISLKRKIPAKPADVWSPVKQSVESYVCDNSKMPVKTSISLQGFINAADIKKEEMNIEDLADEVEDLVLIEAVPLVVKRSTTPSAQITMGTSQIYASKNFKKFRKVQHQNKTILPRIIGGRDLSIHFELKKSDWDKTMNDKENNSDEDSQGEQDHWDFPPQTNGRGRTKATVRKARK